MIGSCVEFCGREDGVGYGIFCVCVDCEEEVVDVIIVFFSDFFCEEFIESID